MATAKASWIGRELAPAVTRGRHDAVQTAITQLGAVLNETAPDVLVHDSWEFAAPIAAAAAGLPSVSQTLGLRHDDRTLDAVAAAVAPLWRRHGLEPISAAGVYRNLCLDITPPSLQSGDGEGGRTGPSAGEGYSLAV